MHKQTTEIQFILPREIDTDTRFAIRDGGTDETHVKALANLYRNGFRVDPIVLLKATDEEAATGKRLVLVDGHHRVEAFKLAHPGSNKGIASVIISGSYEEAFLRALESNRKINRPLSSRERLNAAWKIVREFSGVSKKATAEATGVSRATVGTMRARWKELKEMPDGKASGDWMQDKERADWTPEDMAPEEFQKRVSTMRKKLRQAAGRSQRHNFTLFATALHEAFGKDDLLEAIKEFEAFDEAINEITEF